MCAVEMEAAMVVSGNEGEMEENGVFCSASTGMCGRRFVRGVGVVGVVAWGRRLESLVATAQWVAWVVAWKN